MSGLPVTSNDLLDFVFQIPETLDFGPGPQNGTFFRGHNLNPTEL